MNRIWVKVDDSPIDALEVQSRITLGSLGAQVLFFGVVREWNLGRKVRSVSYDAFVPLAEQTLFQICVEAQGKWGEKLEFVVMHRTGTLTVGEISVGIAVGSPHRDEAYQASRYVIEELKVRVPIWKKESYIDGESEWLRGHALCSHARSEELRG